MGLSFKLGFHVGSFDPKEYIEAQIMNTDYRKLDDTLRMILDCTVEQGTAIRNCLESYRVSGKIFFGIHESNTAIMTCLVFSSTSGEHVHFMDGGDGGYAIAARELKAQMQPTTVSSVSNKLAAAELTTTP